MPRGGARPGAGRKPGVKSGRERIWLRGTPAEREALKEFLKKIRESKKEGIPNKF
jgi:hypothetical protein